MNEEEGMTPLQAKIFMILSFIITFGYMGLRALYSLLLALLQSLPALYVLYALSELI